MICKNCGKKVEDNSNKCNNCEFIFDNKEDKEHREKEEINLQIDDEQELLKQKIDIDIVKLQDRKYYIEKSKKKRIFLSIFLSFIGIAVLVMASFYYKIDSFDDIMRKNKALNSFVSFYNEYMESQGFEDYKIERKNMLFLEYHNKYCVYLNNMFTLKIDSELNEDTNYNVEILSSNSSNTKNEVTKISSAVIYAIRKGNVELEKFDSVKSVIDSSYRYKEWWNSVYDIFIWSRFGFDGEFNISIIKMNGEIEINDKLNQFLENFNTICDKKELKDYKIDKEKLFEETMHNYYYRYDDNLIYNFKPGSSNYLDIYINYESYKDIDKIKNAVSLSAYAISSDSFQEKIGNKALDFAAAIISNKYGRLRADNYIFTYSNNDGIIEININDMDENFYRLANEKYNTYSGQVLMDFDYRDFAEVYNKAADLNVYSMEENWGISKNLYMPQEQKILEPERIKKYDLNYGISYEFKCHTDYSNRIMSITVESNPSKDEDFYALIESISFVMNSIEFKEEADFESVASKLIQDGFLKGYSEVVLNKIKYSAEYNENSGFLITIIPAGITSQKVTDTTAQESNMASAETINEDELNYENLNPFGFSKSYFIENYNNNMIDRLANLKINEQNTEKKDNKLIITPDLDTEITLYLEPENEDIILMMNYKGKFDFSSNSNNDIFLTTFGNIFIIVYYYEYNEYADEIRQIFWSFVDRFLHTSTHYIEIGDYSFTGEYDRNMEILEVEIKNIETS